MCLAVPGRLLDLTGDEELYRMGRVDFGGVVKPVSLACVPEAQVGNYVLVHVGMALSVVDEAEAARVFALLDAMGELAELDPEGAVEAPPGPGERPVPGIPAPPPA